MEVGFRTLFVLFSFLVAYTVVSGPSTGKKSHVSHGPDLSDVAHEVDGLHNPKYDQEALFGKDAKRLDDLTPEEGTEQLRIIVRKMDVDHDGYVTPEELRAWLRKVQQRLSLSDAKRVWEEHDLKPGELLTWEMYSKQALDKDGLYEDYDENEQEIHLARDKIRWSIADSDKDGKLTLEEAVSFLNPESDPRMYDALAQETIDEMDTNKDGMIDVEEYIADLWKPSDGEKVEPDWVKSEREDFVNMRDKNKDGKLDLEEVKTWRFSTDYDYIESEVEHLFSQCDTDRDRRLTESEVESRYDLFVGSVATNYGEVLTDHDEL